MTKEPALKLIAAVIVLVALSGHATAGDTDDQLAAKRVRAKLLIKLSKDKLEVSRDRADSFRTLRDGAPYVASEEFSLLYPDYNPLEVRVSSSQKTTTDPAFTQLTNFLNELGGLGKLVKGGFKGGERGEQLRVSVGCAGLVPLLDELIAALNEGVLEAADVRNWRTGAVGRTGLLHSLQQMETKQKDLEKNITSIQTTMDEITSAEFDASKTAGEHNESSAGNGTALSTGNKIGPNPGTGKPEEPKATGKPATQPAPPAAVASCGRDEFAIAQRLLRTIKAWELLDQKKRLLRSLIALQKDLGDFADPVNWASDKEFLVTRVTPVTGEIVTTTLKARQVTLDPTQLEISIVPKSEVGGSFTVRPYSWLVPETAAGVIVSSIKQPKYGTTKTPEGKTVVSRTSRDDVNYGAAVLLNGVCRCGEGFLRPMLQLGVSAAKDTPALLVGLGLRFTQPKSIGISGGAIVGWPRDLDTLSVGSEVTGTADIENDLKRRATVKGYLALQLTF